MLYSLVDIWSLNVGAWKPYQMNQHGITSELISNKPSRKFFLPPHHSTPWYFWHATVIHWPISYIFWSYHMVTINRWEISSIQKIMDMSSFVKYILNFKENIQSINKAAWNNKNMSLCLWEARDCSVRAWKVCKAWIYLHFYWSRVSSHTT